MLETMVGGTIKRQAKATDRRNAEMSKNVEELTLRELEVQLEETFRIVERKDVPIGRLISEQMSSLPTDGIFLGVKTKCTTKCTANSDGTWSCTVSCTIEF